MRQCAALCLIESDRPIEGEKYFKFCPQRALLLIVIQSNLASSNYVNTDFFVLSFLMQLLLFFCLEFSKVGLPLGIVDVFSIYFGLLCLYLDGSYSGEKQEARGRQRRGGIGK